MQRISTQEILDSDACPPARSRRFAARSQPHQPLVWRSRDDPQIDRARRSRHRKQHFSVLEVAAGFGEVPKAAGAQLARQGITLDVTHLDRVPSHLLPGNRTVVADALALPFPDSSFDLVSSSLFAHHLEPAELARFAAEALRVSRCAVLINDLVRHPLHLALVYAGFPLMRSYVSRFDGVASVRRAYVPDEMQQILSDGGALSGRIEISRHYLFRMGVIVWKTTSGDQHLPQLWPRRDAGSKTRSQ